MNRKLWIAAAAVVLAFCTRVDRVQTIDGALMCKDYQSSNMGCDTTDTWSISFKLPWKRS